MAWSFNPFTGNLDLVGGGGTIVFEGEVETFADLPETVGDPAVGASFLVRSSTGVWLVNRRQAGIWIRRNNTGVRATDWEYGGDYPVNSVNGQTGNVSLTAADVGVNFAAPPAIGNTTPNSGAFTTLTANNGTLTDSQPALTIAQTWNGVAVFDASISATTMTVTSVASGTIRVGMIVTGGSTSFNTVITALGTGTGGTGTYTVSQSQTRASTTLTGAVGFSAAEINITNTGSAANAVITTSRFFDINVDGSLVFSVRRFSPVTNTTFCTNLSVGSSLSAIGVGFDSNGITLGSATSISWRNATSAQSGAQSVALFRDGADDTLAQRRTTNPQTFRLYNTFTDASNHERGFMRWSSNVLQIGTEAAGTGTLRGLNIGTATSSLLGFYGVTPVDQPATVADPAGGGTVDAEARTAINAIIDRLQELGLIA